MKRRIVLVLTLPIVLASFLFTTQGAKSAGPSESCTSPCSDADYVCFQVWEEDWYYSCLAGGDQNCQCQSMRLYNGCMKAHGCPGWVHSNEFMAMLGCPVS